MNITKRRSSSRPSIVLFGLFGDENYGNNASLIAMLYYLRDGWPEAKISAACSEPAFVAQTFDIDAVPIKEPTDDVRSPNIIVRVLRRLFVRIPRAIISWSRTVSYMRSFDMLIVPGTGILDDYSVTWDDLPYSLFRWCLSARLAGARVAFVSVGAGPIIHPLSRWLMTTSARVASYRSYRDQMSKDYMSDLGINSLHDEVYPDLAFGLSTKLDASNRNTEHQSLVVGIGVMAYYGWQNDPNKGYEAFDRYVKKLAEFGLWLLNEGYRLRFIIGEVKDRKAAEAIINRIRETTGTKNDGRLVMEPMRSVSEVLGQICSTDIMIASRFHNFIFGVILEKPVILLNYTTRSAMIHDDVGLGAYCQPIEQFEVSRLVEQFIAVRSDLPSLQQTLVESKHQFQKRLDDQLDGPLKKFVSRCCETDT